MDQWDAIDPTRTRLRVLVARVESTIAVPAGTSQASK